MFGVLRRMGNRWALSLADEDKDMQLFLRYGVFEVMLCIRSTTTRIYRVGNVTAGHSAQYLRLILNMFSSMIE